MIPALRRTSRPRSVVRRTSRRGRLVLLVLGLAALVAGFARPPAATAGSGKSFSLDSLVSEAEIHPDGSMTVVEHVTYRFSGGPFTIGVRSFLDEDRSRIESFRAAEDGQELQVDPPSQTPTGEWEWHFPAPVTDETHTYVLTYDVPDAVTVGTDVGELYWMFLGTDHPGVGTVDVEITLPQPVEVAAEDTPPEATDVLRAWGHGPRNGVVGVDPDRVTLQVDGVPSGRFVEARLAIPRQVFDVEPTGGERLPGILAEESDAIDRTLAADRGRGIEPPPSTFARLIGPLGTLLGLLGAGVLWSKHGREPKPDGLIGEYWREPLDDPPVVALANMNRTTPALGTAFGATMIDLAQRGHVRIREEKIERFGPDKTVMHLTRTGKADTDLEPFERRLLSYVFRDGPETTVDDVTRRARSDKSAAASFAEDFKSDMKQAVTARGYAQRGGTGWVPLFLVVAATAALGALGLVLGSALGVIGLVGAAAVLGLGVIGLRNRTQRGADEAAKADGLKKYIEDFSNLRDAPAGHLILWERFLVFAVAFGVADRLLDGLATRLPSVVNDPAFGAWYIGTDPHRRFDGIDRFPTSFGQATAQAVAPSKSGSGGGFSSAGGGGGGGGGGFGAR